MEQGRQHVDLKLRHSPAQRHIIKRPRLTKLRTTDPRKTYSVAWRVPANVEKKGLKFCIAAYDRTGNHAVPSCASVSVKR